LPFIPQKINRVLQRTSNSCSTRLSSHQPLPCSIFQQQSSKSRTRHLDICPIGR
jgi:hypothetical protein